MFVEDKAAGEPQRDGAMTRLERLERLRYLANHTQGNQCSYDSCLWWEAINDDALRAAGLVPDPVPPAPVMTEKGVIESPFFGTISGKVNGSPYHVMLFGCSTIEDKRLLLDRLIAAERKRTTPQPAGRGRHVLVSAVARLAALVL